MTYNIMQKGNFIHVSASVSMDSVSVYIHNVMHLYSMNYLYLLKNHLIMCIITFTYMWTVIQNTDTVTHTQLYVHTCMHK